MEESIFVRRLGWSPSVKTLGFLFTARDFDYPKNEIADQSNF